MREEKETSKKPIKTRFWQGQLEEADQDTALLMAGIEEPADGVSS